jgi:arylsulfatase A-like enzyme
MTLLRFVQASILLFVTVFSSGQPAGNKSPNILWLSVEDMSPRLGAYGDHTVQTPNIDRLAKEGVLYTNAFSTAGVCAPSRCAIITAMYQTSIGGHNMRTFNIYPEVRGVPKNYSIVPPPEVKGFPEYLRARGYYCTNNQKTDYQFEAPPTMWDENSSAAHYRNRAEGQPFFAVFNAMITHESQIWERSTKPLRVDPSAVNIPPFYPDTDSVRLDIARHYTNIAEMDEWVGEKLQELKDLGELENTIIFFWSDHGDGLPFFKREITDRGLHVPLIIRYPQKENAGTRVHDLVSLIDLGPTALSLAGIQTPTYMQGQAFAGAFKAQPRSYIFGARDRMDVPVDRVRSIRDKRLRYVRNFHPELPAYQPIGYRLQQAGMRDILRKKDANELNAIQMQWFKAPKATEELYALESDPWELNNVVDDPAYQEDVKRLRNALDQWINETNDLGKMPEPVMLKRMWNNGDEPPVTSDPVVTEKKGMVTITVNTAGASVGYQIVSMENENVKSWRVYESPFRIPEGTKISVVAQRIGYKRSHEVMYESKSK